MAENLPSASPFDDQPVPGLHLAAVAEPESVQVSGSSITSAAARPWHSTCSGKVTWRAFPDPDVSQCVLPRGHRGDHRDAGGYPWNEARWAD